MSERREKKSSFALNSLKLSLTKKFCFNINLARKRSMK